MEAAALAVVAMGQGIALVVEVGVVTRAQSNVLRSNWRLQLRSWWEPVVSAPCQRGRVTPEVRHHSPAADSLRRLLVVKAVKVALWVPLAEQGTVAVVVEVTHPKVPVEALVDRLVALVRTGWAVLLASVVPVRPPMVAPGARVVPVALEHLVAAAVAVVGHCQAQASQALTVVAFTVVLAALAMELVVAVLATEPATSAALVPLELSLSPHSSTQARRRDFNRWPRPHRL